jgi:GTPase SAR1 family protein
MSFVRYVATCSVQVNLQGMQQHLYMAGFDGPYDPFIQAFQTERYGEVPLQLFECQPPNYELGDRLKSLDYEYADLIILCFSVDHPDSLESIREKWIEDILYHNDERRRCQQSTRVIDTSKIRSCFGSGRVKDKGPPPFIVLGCQSDMRGNEERGNSLKRAGMSMIKQEEVSGSVIRYPISRAKHCCEKLTAVY